MCPNDPDNDWLNDPPFWEDTESVDAPRAPRGNIDGAMDGYQLVEEMQTRDDIGSILQQNPQAPGYQIVQGLHCSSRNTYASGSDRSILSLILHTPPKAGIVEFLRALLERLQGEERGSDSEQLSAAVAFAMETLLQRKEGRWGDPNPADIALALDLQQALQLPVSDGLRTAATAALSVVVQKNPERSQAFVTAFGVPQEAVRQAVLRMTHTPEAVTALRTQLVDAPANDDPEFRQWALGIVEHALAHGREDPETFRTAYAIPDEEYRNAVWKGLVRRLCMPTQSPTAIADFKRQLGHYGIAFRKDDPEARKLAFSGIEMALMDNLHYAEQLHDMFEYTADDMQPLKDGSGARHYKDVLHAASPDLQKLRQLQRILHITDGELGALLQREHLSKLAQDWPHTDEWERTLQEGGVLTPEAIRRDWEQALREGIGTKKSWTTLRKHATRLGGDAAARLTADEALIVAKDRYLDEVRQGNLQDIAELEKLCDLSLLQGGAEESEAAQRGMQRLLESASVNITGARQMMQKYHLSEDDLQRAAGNAAITHLGAGWHAQLEKIRGEFAVEDALRSEEARATSGKVVNTVFVDWLEHTRLSRRYARERGEGQTDKIFINTDQAEIVLRSLAIGGYDADAIEREMRGGKQPLLPAYEKEHLPAFLLCKRRCLDGFRQSFERDDVREHAETHIVPALEEGNQELAKQHIELTGFPKQRLQEIGLDIFERMFTQGRLSVGLAAAKTCDVEDVHIADKVSQKMREDPANIVPHLEDIPVKVLDRLEREFFLRSYNDDIGLPSVAIYTRYVQLTAQRDILARDAFTTRIKENINTITSGGRQDASITALPYYQDLMTAAFPNNAGAWTSFERNECCEDRTDDLAAYTVRDQYSFTIAPGQDMVLKDGRQRDQEGHDRMHKPLERVHKTYEATEFSREKMLEHFDQELAREAAMLQPTEAFGSREEKLCGLFLEQMRGAYPPDKFKHLLLSYQYAAFQDIREYLQGTRSRAEKSRNPEYAYLLELREFFADRLKDVARTVMETALRNPALREQLPQYFRSCAEREIERSQGQELGRLRIDTLGLSPGFLKQVRETLQRQYGRAYGDDEVRAVIREYEERTDGMAEGAIVDRDLHPAVWGQIRAQRTKTIRAMAVLSGIEAHPSEIRLENVNLQQMLNERRSMVSGDYDEEMFSSYMTRRFGEVTGSETAFIDAEIAKYQAKDADPSVKPKRVEAFITKNHTSAHARGTAGVCVSGDNPKPDSDGAIPANQWQMPNYLQMVLRDAETKICKGCVLMHIEEDAGKKILTAALNPSSTYLYQVNEEEMFRNLREQLIVFAQDNGIDMIAVSHNKQIRTNRTGGLFEQAINKAIAETAQPYTLSSDRVFSYRHAYQQRELDCIWVAPKPEATTAA